LLTRDAVKHLLDELRKTSPAVIDELIPGAMKLGEVQRVLQLLLRENVSIRQLEVILETLADYAPRTRNPIELAEHVRRRLARTICNRYRDQAGRLYVVTLDPSLEEQIRAGAELSDDGLHLGLSPRETDEICSAVEAETTRLSPAGRPPIVLVSPSVRPAVKQLTESQLPQLVVLSFDEVTRDTRVESVGTVALADDQEAAAAGFRRSA
jgi:flagellar biosynthesis protein FlhA